MCILITMVAWMCQEARTCKIEIGGSPISATKSNSKLEDHQFQHQSPTRNWRITNFSIKIQLEIGGSPISASKSNSKLEDHQFRPSITNKQVRYPHDIGLVFIYLIANNRYQYNNVAQYIFT